jgi:hypothetical protein
MTNSDLMVQTHDGRTVRLARLAVIGQLLSMALLCVVAVVYIVVPASHWWGAGLGVGLAAVGVTAGFTAASVAQG